MVAVGRREILSTLFSTDAPIEDWLREVEMLRPRGQVRTVLELVARAGRYRAMVLDGSGRRDQLAAALIGVARRPPKMVISDATWTLGTNPLDRGINRIGLRAIDGPHVTYCVHSTFEVESFPRTWEPLSGRVRFTPWAHTLSSEELARESTENGRIFAGGNSLRDYRPLIEAARTLSVPVDIATSVLSAEQLARLPVNVHAQPVPQRVFDDLMLHASVVVVPLEVRPDRGSGQSVVINAMARGKALVVTDAPGVRDYVEDGETGLVVPPNDALAMRRAIARLLNDPLERRRVASQARDHALTQLTLTNYARRLLEVVHEALDG